MRTSRKKAWRVAGIGLMLLLGGFVLIWPSAGQEPSAGWSVSREGTWVVLGERWLRISARGLFISRDRGMSWQPVTAGWDRQAVPLTICVAPSDSRRLYVGTLRHGVYRSDDGGESWRALGRGLPTLSDPHLIASVERMLVHPEDADLVYAAIDLYGLYRTRNGGLTWEPINEGLPVPLAYRTSAPFLAINPENPSILYALFSTPVHSHRVDNALYKSRDGGDRWEKFLDLSDDLHFEGVRVAPRNPRELEIFVAGGGSVRVLDTESDDAIASWDRAPLARRDARGFESPPDFDAGHIAVLYDDRTLLHHFDLEGTTLQFTPIADGGFALALSDLVFDAEWGERLTLRNDDAIEIALPFPFPFYGRDRTRMFVNSNGTISFGGRRLWPNPSTLSDLPMIAPLWTDLDPSTRGGVFLKRTSTSVVITWADVPQSRKENANTFQVVLQRDGRFLMSFRRVDALTGLTGVFNGNVLGQVFFGRRVDFSEELPLRASVLPSVYEMFDGAPREEWIGRRFYRTHPDDFDMLVIFLASSVAHEGLAYYTPVRNDVGGIGQGVGTFSGGPRAFGSRGRLQGVITMGTLAQYPADPEQIVRGTYSTLAILARETGHRWLAYVRFNDGGEASSALRTPANEWSFFLDTEASVMGGNNWVDNRDGTFESLEATVRYSPLDHYLMGIRSPRDIPDFFLIVPPSDYTRRTPSDPPEVGIIVPGTARMIAVRQIAEIEGWRTPAYPRAPTSFRQTFILVVPPGEEVSASDLEKLERLRQEWEIFFRIATGGRARIIARLSAP